MRRDRRGEARRGEARRGEARRGEARRGEASGELCFYVVGIVKQHVKAPSRRVEPFACLADCRSPWVPAARARRCKRGAEIRRRLLDLQELTGSGMSRVVRIAVVGDAGVGKTSLISTAAHDAFDVRPVPVLPPTRLPASYTPDGVPMVVTDTSSRPEDQQVLDMVLRHSDVVVVCFDATRQGTLDTIRAAWYPRIQMLNPDVPVIMACCKADRLAEEREVALLRERVERSVHDLPHVEVCLNCSSRTLRMVADVFFYALKSVLYPLQPLYDRLEKRLRPLCVRALKRVFVMCDKDGDGALCDPELNGFQLTCFGMALDEGELQNVKQIVASKMPAGVTSSGITLEGFLFLHVLFIERGRLESTWAVLRKFGYSDNLLLSDDVLDRVAFNLPIDQVWELSEAGRDFLRHQFALYDEDGDGLLSWQQLDAMYSTLPPPVWQGEPWNRLLVPGVFGSAHRLDAFLLKWDFEVLTDPRNAYAHLLYLGFGGPDGSGGPALLTKRCRHQLQKRHKAELAARTCVQCLVFGPLGAGKTSLLKALVGQRPEHPSPATLPLPASAPTRTHPPPPGATPPPPATYSMVLTQAPPASDGPGGAAGGGEGDPAGEGGEGEGEGEGGRVACKGQPLPAEPKDRQEAGGAAQPSGGYGSALSGGPPCAVAIAHGPDDKERTLLLQEVTEDIEQQVLTSAALAAMGPPLLTPPPGSTSDLPDLARADVAAFVFDSSSRESFQAAVDLLVKVSSLAGETLPCVLVAAKDELVMSAALEAEVAATCQSLQVPLPVSMSAQVGDVSALFSTLVAAALLKPEAWLPETPARKARRRLIRQVLLGTTVGAAAAATLYLAYRILSSPAPGTSSPHPSPGLPLPASSPASHPTQPSHTPAKGLPSSTPAPPTPHPTLMPGSTALAGPANSSSSSSSTGGWGSVGSTPVGSHSHGQHPSHGAGSASSFPAASSADSVIASGAVPPGDPSLLSSQFESGLSLWDSVSAQLTSALASLLGPSTAPVADTGNSTATGASIKAASVAEPAVKSSGCLELATGACGTIATCGYLLRCRSGKDGNTTPIGTSAQDWHGPVGACGVLCDGESSQRDRHFRQQADCDLEAASTRSGAPPSCVECTGAWGRKHRAGLALLLD
ncbi:hypothetical protein QJQ45_017887 [Haematococcus lacustris]|nr:hypothetical protein QJQ45_017887 [Haematococcus lacustris]